MMTPSYRPWTAGLATAVILATGCQRQLPPDVPPNLQRAMTIRAALSSSAGRSPTASSSSSSAQPTGWATLRGVIKVDGPVPEPPTLDVTRDAEVCAPGGEVPRSEALVVAPDGGIKNVVIYLTSKIPDTEPWTHPSAKPGQTGDVEFDQKFCVFTSRVLGMQATQRLKILNSDPIGHNTNISPDVNAKFNQTIAAHGQTFFEPTAEERQPFSVTCSIHPWMQAWVITRRNSYYAVTQADGSFEIANLPAGVDLEFRVWQETSKFVRDATATINGKPQSVSKGRMTLNLPPDSGDNNRLELTLNASLFQ